MKKAAYVFILLLVIVHGVDKGIEDLQEGISWRLFFYAGLFTFCLLGLVIELISIVRRGRS